MKPGELIGCHDCGCLYQWQPLAVRERARCGRCQLELYRWHASGPTKRTDTMVALTLSAVLVFIVAQCFPIVTLQMAGMSSGVTLPQAVAVLWGEGMGVIATLVLLCGIVFPGLELSALLYVALGLRRRVRVPGFNLVLRTVQGARHWAMTEVLMIGILVTVIKMTSLARVVPHPGLFAFGVLTILCALVMRYEPRALWALADRQVPQPDEVGQAGHAHHHEPRHDHQPPAELIACDTCGLVNRLEPGAHQALTPKEEARTNTHCCRCKASLHRRIPHSIGWTWAMLAAAALLYIPANMLPVMYTQSVGGTEGDTIMSGVRLFWNTGSKGLAIIIFIASIAVPVSKLLALVWLNGTAQLRSRAAPLARTRAYRVVEFIGRWSMLDIFVVTLTVALVRFDVLAAITAGPGAIAFGCVVILTMVASAQFDPRLIWDPIDSYGEPQHA
ncbi:paraquat-inducible protein A [Pseudoduganella lurida]|uniref:Paraquat-inducible protein A n=1 Tax=Pseudoduganella lurida TaxID=1036180 RepID=A0A562R0J5_9BURK|nr:paraquat-inducible protein A [Pseudoduganella lurida]TWI62592.1 paraquat-inducible protein A [Pseudoduganella lurida]